MERFLFLTKLLSVFLVLPLGRSQFPVPTSELSPQVFSSPRTCAPAREFFNTSYLTCTACPTNQTETENGLSCRCLPGFYRPIGSSIITPNCQSCPSDTVVSHDGLFCLRCEGGTSFDSVTRECIRCSMPTDIFVDVLPTSQADVGTRSCRSCPLGTWRDGPGFSCIKCGISDCRRCVVVSGLCFSPSVVLPALPINTFSFYSQQYSFALEQCEFSSNTTACQVLINLCVLQTYLLTDPACVRSFLLVMGQLPPIYFSPGAAEIVLQQTRLRTELPTRGATSSLPLVLASYSLNGTFLAFEEELTQQILLCQECRVHSQAAWRVGVHYQIQCSLSTSELTKRANSPVFYDLFYRDDQPNSAPAQLIPVPVLVTNYRTPSNQPAMQYVRRFFLAEAVTRNPQYARTMELIVNMWPNGGMHVPYLRITYASWTPTSDSTQTLPSSYSTVYNTVYNNELVIGLVVTICILLLCVMVYAGLRVNGFIRRSGNICCDIHTFIYAGVEVCGAFSSVIFVILTITASFMLIFFKGQSAFFFTLPTSTQEIVFEVFLGLSLFCRVIHTLYLIWHQCTVDIFFMDWERPRGLILSSHQTVSNGDATPTPVPTPVSIWRTYFVANEWNEIQSLRKINHTFLLILVLLFTEVVGLGNLAERDPVADVRTTVDRYSAPASDILRFAISSLHFIIIALIMRLYVFFIHARFVENKLNQFIDLCSVGNISVFILPRKLFGHYIHGHSPHGHADTDMRDMNWNLLKEGDGMCGNRGLENESDLQTYELALTTEFRTKLDMILGPLKVERAERAGQADHRGRRPSTQRRNDNQGLSETVMKTYEAMNHFLTSFFERNIQGLDYCIKNKLLPERAVGIELHDPETKSFLYRDSGLSFDQLLFYGHCWNLFQLDLLIFAVVDLLSQNYILAAIITYIISLVINLIRDALGRWNLARKTLVDNRFLI